LNNHTQKDINGSSSNDIPEKLGSSPVNLTSRVMKYNPAFLSDKELIRNFAVRDSELQQILETLRSAPDDHVDHLLIVGQRGSGKTTLIHRIAAEIHRDPELSPEWFPLVLAEESYPVMTAGEFWLEALTQLGHVTNRDSILRISEELREEHKDERLANGALAKLGEFCEVEGKRLLLVVENFNMFIDGQISTDDLESLRNQLISEPRILLIATAIKGFDAGEDPDQPFKDLFTVLELQPLDAEGCKMLWESVTGEVADPRRIHAIHILTGGNPRLVVFISQLGMGRSLKDLMDDFLHLVDDHTEYFKYHLDNLAPTERKVYLALAELWKPSTTKEIAQLARLNVNTTSSYLLRLIKRGMVIITEDRPRHKEYAVAERMYNLYYLMRRRGTSSSRVRAFIDFMVAAYGQKRALAVITNEAIQLDPESRRVHFTAYNELLKTPCGFTRSQIIQKTPREFFSLDDTPDEIRALNDPDFVTFGDKGLKISDTDGLIRFGEALLQDPNQLELAGTVFRKVIGEEPTNTYAWMKLCHVYKLMGDLPRAESAIQKAINSHSDTAEVWVMFGLLLSEIPGREAEAEAAFIKATKLSPKNPTPWYVLGMHYLEELERYNDAEYFLRRSIEIDPNCLFGWEGLAIVLHQHLDQPDEAEEGYWNAIRLGSIGFVPYVYLSQLLLGKLDCCAEALEPMRIYLERTRLVKDTMDLAISTFEWWAACDCGPVLLKLIEESPSAELLEPLTVGIKLYLGQDVNVPAEVLAVGTDIKQRIQDYTEQTESKPDESRSSPEG